MARTCGLRRQRATAETPESHIPRQPPAPYHGAGVDLRAAYEQHNECDKWISLCHAVGDGKLLRNNNGLISMFRSLLSAAPNRKNRPAILLILQIVIIKLGLGI